MRKKSILFCGAFAILGLFALVEASDIASPKKELLTMQHRRFEAMIRADLPALKLLLAEDLTYTHTNGKTESKTNFLSMLETGNLKYEAIETTSENVRMYGDTGVITGRSMMKVLYYGMSITLNTSFIAVQVKSEGRWQLVAWQSTRLQ
jgi:hypothetical protein